MSENLKVVIPDNHKRSLSVTAMHIENSINEIEDLLINQNGKEQLTEKIVFNLSDEQRKSILAYTKVIREKNKIMFNELNLNYEKLYEDRLIRSKLSHIWVILSDSTTEALKGYGEVYGEAADLINKNVNSLLETVNEAQSIV